jgi:hypothetical protein
MDVNQKLCGVRGAAQIALYGLPIRAYNRFTMREFFYGLILGALSIYCYHHFDAPGILSYLNDATEYAAKSTAGYGGKANKPR